MLAPLGSTSEVPKFSIYRRRERRLTLDRGTRLAVFGKMYVEQWGDMVIKCHGNKYESILSFHKPDKKTKFNISGTINDHMKNKVAETKGMWETHLIASLDKKLPFVDDKEFVIWKATPRPPDFEKNFM